MYRNINNGEFSIYDFILPFGAQLKEDYRWVQLRNMNDEEYNWHFKKKASGQEVSLMHSFWKLSFSLHFR